MSTSTLHPLSRMLPSKPEGPMRSPARVLGWFSIGLGLAQLLMPSKVARAAAMPDVPLLARLCGLREIGVGVGLLNSRDPTPWLWGRVAGDALDGAMIGTGLITARRPFRTLTSLATVCGIGYIDMQCAMAAAPRESRPAGRTFDYSKRSGFKKPAAEMRGAALRPLGGAVGSPAGASIQPGAAAQPAIRPQPGALTQSGTRG